MRLLRRYIGHTVFLSTAGVLLALLGLDIVFAVIAELDDLSPTYHVKDVLSHVMLGVPNIAYELIPVACLIGALIGLGILANNSELTVIRSAGVAPVRIVGYTLRPALVFIALGLALAQYVIPMSEQLARSQKALASGGGDGSVLHGYWHREGQDFVHIGVVQPNGVLNFLDFYRYAGEGRLVAFGSAERALFQGDGHWQLQNWHASQIAPSGEVGLQSAPVLDWHTALSPSYLRLATLEPEFLSLSNLYVYANYLARQGLSYQAYLLEFWKKAIQPVATIAMVLLASSFIFGPLRSVTMGLRLVTGVFLGLTFRYGQDFFGFASIVYHFSPFWGAVMPVAVAFLLGVLAMVRVR